MSEHRKDRYRNRPSEVVLAAAADEEGGSPAAFSDIFPDVDERECNGAYLDDVRPDESFIRKERQAARELRESQWWKAALAAGKCHYCGRSFKPSELTMDHIVPVGRGGRSIRSNVVPCCKECNNRKKYLLPVEMVRLTSETPSAEAKKP